MTCSTKQQAYISCVQLFTASVTAEVLVALDVLDKSQLQLSSVFPHTIPTHLGKVSKFFLCSLSLFPPPICCLFMLELHHGFPVQPNQSPSMPACLPKYEDGPFLCLEDALVKDLPAFLSSFTRQRCLPGDPM